MDSYLVQILLQNATAILLQNATKVYFKMCQFFITKRDSFITKYDIYYKMQRFYYKMHQYLINAKFIKPNIRNKKCLSYLEYKSIVQRTLGQRYIHI